MTLPPEVSEVLEGRRQWWVIHADCLDVLPLLPKADAVVTDPPYGIEDAPIRGQGRSCKRTGGVNTWHPESDWDSSINPEWCVATGRAAIVVAWFGHWRKRDEVARSMLLPLRCEIIWAKDCHVGPPNPVSMRDERIWLFSGPGIKPRHFETSVWDEPIIPTWAHRWHKNEKPLGLMQRLVAFLTDGGRLVLDPFTGSGTTGVACIRLGRRFIGIEKDATYAAIARERLEAESRGLTLKDARMGQTSIFDALGTSK